MQTPVRTALRLYLAATAVLLIGAAALVLHGGLGAILRIQHAPRASSLAINFIAFCVTWLLFGGLLALARAPAFARRHAVFLFAFTLVAFAYLHLIREPHAVGTGDFPAYYQAAVRAAGGESVYSDTGWAYLYPPLLAEVLSPLARFDIQRAARVFHVGNYLGVLALAVLLYLGFQRYRLGREIAGLTVLCMMTANVPLQRTLIYHQVNIHVANLMLAALLCHPRWPALSALALAVATHLKLWPVLLVVPFILARHWRWCAWFAAANALLVAATSALFGFSPYRDAAAHLGGIVETGYANVAVDAVTHNTLRLFDERLLWLKPALSHALRIPLVLGALLAYWRLRARPVFADGEPAALMVLNGFVVLPVAMLAPAPSIWEHHFVLWMLPLGVLFTAVRSEKEFLLVAAAYVFVFLVPVFSIYPVSYLRLVAIVLVIVMLHLIAAHPAGGKPEWLAEVDALVADARTRWTRPAPADAGGAAG